MGLEANSAFQVLFPVSTGGFMYVKVSCSPRSLLLVRQKARCCFMLLLGNPLS